MTLVEAGWLVEAQKTGSEQEGHNSQQKDR